MANPKNKKFTDKVKSIGTEAGKIAHDVVLKQCKQANITVPRVLKEIDAGLKATEVKASFSAPDGKFYYSKKLTAWGVRQKAVDQAVAILGIKAPEKSEVALSGPVKINVVYEGKDENNDNETEE